jgi:NTP pyrophosphatase (non-canonical NTP hydrolase)
MTIAELCVKAEKEAAERGFTELNVYKQLAWLSSEVGEAFNDYRKGNMEEYKFELADVAIILFHLCQQQGVDLEKYVLSKMAINRAREMRHGDVQ